ncbi:unnamed protein product [Paramecium primaurelia]|uniref:Uncharacterized protein n=1 Tax=Paramecium primaurelia TaxID=5886 RepID=A0A8S1Q143_PARPR|nr:unnamed protein product [Paramecium primaurelia]
MNKKLANTYNQISDVFSRAQIKNAVESLDNYHDRLKLIDSIIDRRQQIRQANDLSKITKYAHIFRKMIQRYRNKKEDQAANQRLQMQMVMSMFAPKGKQSSPRHLYKNLEQRKIDPQQLKIKEISEQRRDAVQLKMNRTSKISNFHSDRKYNNQRNNTKEGCRFSNRTQRFLSSIDVDDQYQEKELYLWSVDDKEIKSLQSKIKQSVILKTRINLNQNTKDNENVLKLLQKQQSTLSRRQYKPYSQPQLQDLGDKEQDIQKYDQMQNLISQEGSYLSYSENRLNQLYKKTFQIQTNSFQSQHNQQKLIKTNKEIIEISKIKLAPQKY